jgi:hypothetical protein
LEGQYRFDFENDSWGTDGSCLCEEWIQAPEGRWCCDSLAPLEGRFSLHHCYDNPVEGVDYLVLRHDPVNPAWPFSCSFRIRHGFDPSSLNNWQVVLGAEFLSGGDKEGNPPVLWKGIVLGVNYTGSDDMVKLWQVGEADAELLLSTTLNYQDQVGTELSPLFLLQGDAGGGLDLYVAIHPDTGSAVHLGTCILDDFRWGRHLAVRYQYSALRDRGLWLDDLTLGGYFEPDTVGPGVIRTEVLNGRSLKLDFSETVRDPAPGLFRLSSEEDTAARIPTSLFRTDQSLELVFEEEIPNRVPQHLRVGGVEDLDGNLSADTVVDFLRNEAAWGDLVINEVMADPDPAVRITEEYLELYNRCGFPLNLEGWLLQVNERDYLLEPPMLELVCGENREPELPSATVFPGGFAVLRGVTLPNEGATLSIRSPEGRLVHAVAYRNPWDGPDWKKEGGWSLESPDPEAVCGISSNWAFSEDPDGGTPCRLNSVQSARHDTEGPVPLYSGLGGAGEWLIHYDEPVRLPPEVRSGIRLDPGAVLPDSVWLVPPLDKVLQIRFPEDFREWSRYRLTAGGIRDCQGNPAGVASLEAGTLAEPGAGLVIINEIMYDPEEDKAEYVELWLQGDRAVDLADFSIHMVEEDGIPDRPLALSPHSRLFLPGQYLVLTSSAGQLMHGYGLGTSGLWVEVEDWPGLKNSGGKIYLTDRAGRVVDAAVYREDMHMELLADPGGVSLERITARGPGTDPANWHSAASAAGYATPGERNSQSLEEGYPDRLLELRPEVFSPDNDGYEDLLTVTVTTGSPGWVIGVFITDLQGNMIRELANNHLAGPVQSYTWDGEGGDGSLQPMGFYVVHARGFHPATGERWVRRKGAGLRYR